MLGHTCIEVHSELFVLITNNDRINQLATGWAGSLDTKHREKRLGAFRNGGVVELLNENGHWFIDDFDPDDGAGWQRRWSTIVSGHHQFEFRIVTVQWLTQEYFSRVPVYTEELATTPQQLVSNLTIFGKVFVDRVNLKHNNIH